MSVERLLRVREACELLAISRTKLYEMLYRGEIRSIRVGGARRIPESALSEWLAQRVRAQDDNSISLRNIDPRVASLIGWAKATTCHAENVRCAVRIRDGSHFCASHKYLEDEDQE